MKETFDHTIYQNMEFNDNPLTRSLEDSNNFSIKWYRSLYGGKDMIIKIYKHMFFTIGNGYTWRKGRLVEHSLSTDEHMLVSRKEDWVRDCEADKRRAEFFKKLLTDLSKPKNPDFLNKQLEKMESYAVSFEPFRMKFPDDENGITELPNSVSTHGKINEIPDNVKDDYLLGAVECVDFYIEKFQGDDSDKYKRIVQTQSDIYNRFGDRLNNLKK